MKVTNFVIKTPYTKREGEIIYKRRIEINTIDEKSHLIQETVTPLKSYTEVAFHNLRDRYLSRLPGAFEDIVFIASKNNGLGSLIENEGLSRNLRLAKR